MALFYFVRHAETEWNANNRLCGRTDVPLSEAGRLQAARLAERLRPLPPRAVYASPLQRALETARIIAATSGVEPVVDSRLAELNYGTWEGKTYAEVTEQDPAFYRAWDADPGTVAPPGGESGQQAFARAVPFLDELAARHPGRPEHVVVVSHKTICRLIVCHVLGIPPSQYRRRLSMENAAVNIIVRSEQGWRLILLNDTSHLAPTHLEAASLNGIF